MKDHQYYVYIITNKNNAVLYIGVTNDVRRRVDEHKSGINQGFTKQYHCNKLVYYEVYQWIQEAIAPRKTIKGRIEAEKDRFDHQGKPLLERP